METLYIAAISDRNGNCYYHAFRNRTNAIEFIRKEKLEGRRFSIHPRLQVLDAPEDLQGNSCYLTVIDNGGPAPLLFLDSSYKQARLTLKRSIATVRDQVIAAGTAYTEQDISNTETIFRINNLDRFCGICIVPLFID